MDRQQRITVGAVAVMLAATVLPPLLLLCFDGLRSAAAVAAVIDSVRLRELWLRSFALASAVAGSSMVVGVPLGVLFGRSDLAARRAAWAIHALPLFLPPFLLALGWFEGVRATLGSASFLFASSSAVLILVLALSPIVTSLTAIAAMRVDPSLVEAAMIVSSPRRVLTSIVLPSCWAPAALGGVFVFAMTFAELGVPLFLRVDVYPAAVFSRLGGVRYDPGEAFALTLPLSVVAIALFAVERRLARGAFPTLGMRSAANSLVPLRGARAPLSLVAWIGALLGVAPLVALSAVAAPGLADVGPWLGDTPWNSLLTGGVAAGLCTIAGVVLGHARGRSDSILAAAIDAALVLAFVIPATVIGIGLVGVWNRSSTQFVYGSAAMVVIALVARYAFVGVRIAGAVFATSPPELEDAARVCGARYGRRMLRIMVPLNARALLGTFLLVLVFCMRDLETPMLLYPAGSAPLVVQIFTLEANGPRHVVAALAMTQVAMTAALLALAAFLARARARS